MTSERPYRKGRSFEEAFSEVEKCAGTQFDPALVEVALSIPKADWLEAKRNTLRRLRPPPSINVNFVEHHSEPRSQVLLIKRGLD